MASLEDYLGNVIVTLNDNIYIDLNTESEYYDLFGIDIKDENGNDVEPTNVIAGVLYVKVDNKNYRTVVGTYNEPHFSERYIRFYLDQLIEIGMENGKSYQAYIKLGRRIDELHPTIYEEIDYSSNIFTIVCNEFVNIGLNANGIDLPKPPTGDIINLDGIKLDVDLCKGQDYITEDNCEYIDYYRFFIYYENGNHLDSSPPIFVNNIESIIPYSFYINYNTTYYIKAVVSLYNG